jgi:hypothetical protein
VLVLVLVLLVRLLVLVLVLLLVLLLRLLLLLKSTPQSSRHPTECDSWITGWHLLEGLLRTRNGESGH